MSRISRCCAVFVALLSVTLLTLISAGPASAHAVLLETAPANGASVPVAPSSVAMTFDEGPIAKFSTIHVTGPDGKRVDAGSVQLDGNVLRQPLSGPLPAGSYSVDWRIVADDGHPESGQFSFVSRAAAGVAAATGTASAAAGPSAGHQSDQPATEVGAASTSTKSSGSGPSTGVIVGLVALVLVIGGAGSWLLTRRQRTAGRGDDAHE